MNKYVETGVEELSQKKLPVLLELKYQSIVNAEKEIGDALKIRSLFLDFQKKLYEKVR